jgi:hypothetical protein
MHCHAEPTWQRGQDTISSWSKNECRLTSRNEFTLGLNLDDLFTNPDMYLSSNFQPQQQSATPTASNMGSIKLFCACIERCLLVGMVVAAIHRIDTSSIHGAAAFILTPAATFTTRTLPVSRLQLLPLVLHMASSEENSGQSSSPETLSSPLQTGNVEVKCPNCDQCDGSGRYASLFALPV